VHPSIEAPGRQLGLVAATSDQEFLFSQAWCKSNNCRYAVRTAACTQQRVEAHHLEGAITVVSEELLSLLVCPLGKSPLLREGSTLVCSRCGPRFAINDDIPNMLIDEAELPAGCSCLNDLDCVKSGEVKVDLAS
jgi:uncharacterized protein YbaR (Trm112 family)